MNIPPKYEDVVAQLEAALGREAALKKVINFSDAVACVFDMLKYAAANTSCKEWDSQLEDLAEDVIEFAPEYKKQWKDICDLQQRLTVAERRAGELEELLRDAENAHGKMLLSDPPQESWKHHRISERIAAALKPAEYHIAKLPDFWPCKSAEELARFEAWEIKEGNNWEGQPERGEES